MINSSMSGFDKPEFIPHTRISSQSQIESNYEIGEKIGQGSFGKVFAVVEKSTRIKWAMKCLHKVEKSLAIKLLEREIAILKQVQHENIIQLKEVFETHDKVFLIMEYCGGGELANELLKVKKFPESEVKKIMSSLASAIAYLHKSDIVHRDLKLSNILLCDDPANDGNHFIKVTDFGLSVVKGGVGHENMLNSFCGTLIYMAPEVLENKTYSQQCDIWAMGIIAYQLLCGNPPFMSDDEETLMDLIRTGEFEFASPDWDDISSDAKNCIQNMLHLDTAYRLTAAEVLQHSWFTGMKHEDHPLTGNILEMMSNWKDDLIKEHLKEDMDNEIGSDDSWEDADLELTEKSSVESERSLNLPEKLQNSKKSSSKDSQAVSNKAHTSSLPASGTSRSSTDKPLLSKSLLGRSNRSAPSKPNPEKKTTSLIGQSQQQMKSKKL